MTSMAGEVIHVVGVGSGGSRKEGNRNPMVLTFLLGYCLLCARCSVMSGERSFFRKSSETAGRQNPEGGAPLLPPNVLCGARPAARLRYGRY